VKLKRIGIVVAVFTGLAQPQSKNASTPKFEVTSVRLNKTPDLCKGLLQFRPGGTFSGTNVPLTRMIAVAWALPMQSPRITLSSGVKIPEEVYDLEATSPEGAFPPGTTGEARFARMKLMLQALREERFKLKVRTERKEQPVYALVIGKGGPRLEKSKFQEPDCGEEFGPKLISNPACRYLDGNQDSGLHGASVTIAQVAYALQNWTDQPVFDKTALAGYYDIQTEGWVPMRTDDPAERCKHRRHSFRPPDHIQRL
jgi:uncharacterized protein (TIGR03435 family)